MLGHSNRRQIPSPPQVPNSTSSSSSSSSSNDRDPIEDSQYMYSVEQFMTTDSNDFQHQPQPQQQQVHTPVVVVPPTVPAAQVTSSPLAQQESSAKTKGGKTHNTDTKTTRRGGSKDAKGVEKSNSKGRAALYAQWESVAHAFAKEYSLDSVLLKPNKKGVRYVGETKLDEAPRKITEIPVGTEIEFVDWQRFLGKFSIGYTLYTKDGIPYWANARAANWLETARIEGKVPGLCTFFVCHETEKVFRYGFKFLVDAAEFVPPAPAPTSASAAASSKRK